MEQYSKPLPEIDSDSQPFWESCQRHAMAIQRCTNCGRWRFPPRVLCPQCLSSEAEWKEVSGQGKVYTYVVMHHAFNPAWQEEVPYNVSMIELDEGVRMWTNMVGCQPEDIYVGMPVKVTYEDATPEVTLPKFGPAE